MSLNLKILSAFFCLIIIFIVLYFVRKNKIIVKYSFIWLTSSVFLLILILFPQLLGFMTKLIGIQVASNMVFSLVLALLIFITISLTIIVSSQTKKIRLLIQEVSMLKIEQESKNN